MFKVIPLFSLLNDDLKIENGRIFLIMNTDFVNSMNFNTTQAPLFIIFTDGSQ